MEKKEPQTQFGQLSVAKTIDWIEILFLMLFYFKITEQVGCSWIWVFSPLWIRELMVFTFWLFPKLYLKYILKKLRRKIKENSQAKKARTPNFPNMN